MTAYRCLGCGEIGCEKDECTGYREVPVEVEADELTAADVEYAMWLAYGKGE